MATMTVMFFRYDFLSAELIVEYAVILEMQVYNMNRDYRSRYKIKYSLEIRVLE